MSLIEEKCIICVVNKILSLSLEHKNVLDRNQSDPTQGH